MPTVVELLRVERSEQAKARRSSAAGIWLKVLVAYQRDVTFSVESHPNSEPYPIVAMLLGFSSLFARKNFDYAKRKRFSPLRMTG